MDFFFTQIDKVPRNLSSDVGWHFSTSNDKFPRNLSTDVRQYPTGLKRLLPLNEISMCVLHQTENSQGICRLMESDASLDSLNTADSLETLDTLDSLDTLDTLDSLDTLGTFDTTEITGTETRQK